MASTTLLGYYTATPPTDYATVTDNRNASGTGTVVYDYEMSPDGPIDETIIEYYTGNKLYRVDDFGFYASNYYIFDPDTKVVQYLHEGGGTWGFIESLDSRLTPTDPTYGEVTLYSNEAGYAYQSALLNDGTEAYRFETDVWMGSHTETIYDFRSRSDLRFVDSNFDGRTDHSDGSWEIEQSLANGQFRNLEYDASGRLVEEQRFNVGGTIAYDTEFAADGTTTTLRFSILHDSPDPGLNFVNYLASETVAHTDGSSEAIYYDNAGHTLRMVDREADGSQIQYKYSLAGSLTEKDVYSPAGLDWVQKFGTGGGSNIYVQANKTYQAAGSGENLFSQGSDSFVFKEHLGSNTINNFRASGPNQDKVVFDVSAGESFADLTIGQSGHDAVVHLHDDTVVLKGISVAMLDQGDFLFV